MSITQEGGVQMKVLEAAIEIGEVSSGEGGCRGGETAVGSVGE